MFTSLEPRVKHGLYRQRCCLSDTWTSPCIATLTNSKIHVHTHGYTRSNLGFSVMPKDSSTCRLEEVGIKPLTL